MRLKMNKILIFFYISFSISLVTTVILFKSGLEPKVVCMIALVMDKLLIFSICIAIYIKMFGFRIKTYVKNGLPYFNQSVLLSSLTVFLFSRVDQIYLGEFVSEELVAIYFIYLKFFELVNLGAFTLLYQKLKKLLETENNEKSEIKIIRLLLGFVIFGSLFIAFLAFLLAEWLYGFTYENSTVILFLIIVITVFATTGIIRGPWVAKNERYKVNFYCTFLGATVAILYLIVVKPSSMEYVAITAVIGQSVANFFAPLFFKQERKHILSIIGISK